jgi:hypothetical protein
VTNSHLGWYVGERRDGAIDVRQNNTRSLIATVSTGRLICEDNARLIAAAPDLLAALKAMVDDLEARWDMSAPSTNPGIRHNVEQAKAAIAKAVGGPS